MVIRMEFRFSETQQWTAEPGSSLKGIACITTGALIQSSGWQVSLQILWQPPSAHQVNAPNTQRTSHDYFQLKSMLHMKEYHIALTVFISFIAWQMLISLGNYFFSLPSPAILNPSIILQAELTPKPLLDHLPLTRSFQNQSSSISSLWSFSCLSPISSPDSFSYLVPLYPT